PRALVLRHRGGIAHRLRAWQHRVGSAPRREERAGTDGGTGQRGGGVEARLTSGAETRLASISPSSLCTHAVNIDKEMRDEYFDGFIRSGVRRKYVNHGLLKFVARTPQETYTYRSVQPNLSELDHLKEEVGYL